MNLDLILSQLLSVRATVEALIAEVQSVREMAQCCDNPKIVKTETYGGTEIVCANCGKEQSAPCGPNDGG